MKSLFSIRGKLLIALVATLFSATALAQVPPTWVKDGVEWSKYDKFLVKPLNVSDVRLIPPPWAENPEEWEINKANMQTVRAIYRDVMRTELGYPIVYTPQAGALEINVEILSVTPWIRPNEGGSMEGLTVTTMGTGELTASLEIRDSETRELLLLLAGEKSVGEEYKEFTRANNASNVEAMFKAFAHRLRGALDKVHAK